MLTSHILLPLILAGGLQAKDVDPFESALVAAVHHFAREGSLDHLQAILDKYPRLVDALEPRPSGHKPDSSEGYTPLDWAASRGQASVAEYLIRRGAKVNAADGRGWTALHLAARDGQLAVVKLLVEHGADIVARTEAIPESSGIWPGSPPLDPTKPTKPPEIYPAIPSRTPLDWAVAMEQVKVVDYLRSLKK